MYAGKVRPGVVAALVEHLPAACAVGRELGGASAMSDEWHALSRVDLSVRNIGWMLGGAKGDQPKVWDLPEGRREREAREEREAVAMRRYKERVAAREEIERSGGRMTLRDL